MLLLFDMTIGAGNAHVRALQRVVRQGVVECGWIQPHDVSLPSLVIRMTAATRGRGETRCQAVKALAGREIRTHVLMTPEAEPVLGGTIEGAVATRALLFVFRMTLDHGTGHQQCLGICSAKPGGQDADEEECGESANDQNRCTASTWTAAAPNSRNASGR